MVQKSYNRTFNTIAIVLFCVLLVLYIDVSLLKEVIGLHRVAFLIGTIVISVWYLSIYRRHNLMCFDSIFLAIYILGVFFQELILDTLDDSIVSSRVYHFSSATMDKGLLVQSLALLAYLIASSLENNKNNSKLNIDTPRYFITTSYSLCVNVLSVMTLGYICLLFFNGTISSWFHYSNNSSNYTNTAIVYLTTLFLALTIYEFAELSRIGCDNFKSFLKNVDRLYIIEITVICLLLLISGNRNEALLFIFPPIFAYSAMIKPISNKVFILGMLVGIAVMTVIGVTREFGISANSIKDSEISLYEVTRDYGVVNKNTNYLIEYTDIHGPIWFKNTVLVLASSIPYLGGFIKSTFDLSSHHMRSAELTTLGMQSKSNMDSGLGTSLIGDLYYTGSFVFVILFMYFLGWLIAYLHNRLIMRKSFNIWLFIIYLFLTANVAYYVRAEWTMPFRYIGFTFVIILFINIFSQKVQVYK